MTTIAEMQRNALEVSSRLADAGAQLDRLKEIDVVVAKVNEIDARLQPKRLFGLFR